MNDMRMRERRRRVAVVMALLIGLTGGGLFAARQQTAPPPVPIQQASPTTASSPANTALEKLPVKGRAPKTGYSREQFGNGWNDLGACDVRNHILRRDLVEAKVRSDTDCTVLSGTLHDSYTAKTISFVRGPGTSSQVQIDHVVALSDAWQKGAQQLSADVRRQLANDPLELIAVEGKANQNKSDGDAATWLPPNKPYRCQYVARQIAVKMKYQLWVTTSERSAMQHVLDNCPNQTLPVTTP